MMSSTPAGQQSPNGAGYSRLAVGAALPTARTATSATNECKALTSGAHRLGTDSGLVLKAGCNLERNIQAAVLNRIRLGSEEAPHGQLIVSVYRMANPKRKSEEAL